jgi:23S rRNA (pseudouridine1915-N3)-methyltransferase
MKIKILCLGRLNKDEENELCKRYESRLKSLKNSGITSFAIEHISKKELENIIKNSKKTINLLVKEELNIQAD